jgi:hypothetical protein
VIMAYNKPQCVRESLPMQDEPERRTGFQYKMSLKD